MKPLLEFFPIVLFFVTYKLYDIYIATAVVIASTVVQVIAYWLLYRKVETMQWITLGLILVMGGATLYLQDEQFIKWKLTIIEWLFGGAFLVSQYVGKKTFIERMMGANLELPDRIWKRLNISWSMFFIGVGCLNLYVMANYSTDDWVSFKTFGVPGLMLIFVAVQMVFLYKFVPAPEAKE
ncbi:septation protein A [Methylomonas albis]|jgi:intracellular septation protein|uniref:Inner membrane-spanning protein YciB n=1 Tax=Methylomonas albis TaxID=1854563 RepID=A0ABR9CXT9_9GAMM|nr:septation protein A [Methylomonas albis]MBD9355331.1 septation protein A [Methylomonas albis]